MKVALVGLPQSGKTFLFTALTGTEPSRGKAGIALGIVKVPDARDGQSATETAAT